MESAADLIEVNSTAALAFEDAGEAVRVLYALRTVKNIREGLLYRPDGRVFAKYQREDYVVVVPDRVKVTDERLEWAKDHLGTFRPIYLEGRRIGYSVFGGRSGGSERRNEKRRVAGLSAV